MAHLFVVVVAVLPLASNLAFLSPAIQQMSSFSTFPSQHEHFVRLFSPHSQPPCLVLNVRINFRLFLSTAAHTYMPEPNAVIVLLSFSFVFSSFERYVVRLWLPCSLYSTSSYRFDNAYRFTLEFVPQEIRSPNSTEQLQPSHACTSGTSYVQMTKVNLVELWNQIWEFHRCKGDGSVSWFNRCTPNGLDCAIQLPLDMNQ